jgi:hydroxyacylglutathione hydrolase
MPPIELEDNVYYILSKAYRGLTNDGVVFSASEKALIEDAIRVSESASVDSETLAKCASLLELHGPSLELINQSPYCEPIELPNDLVMHVLPFGSYTVNAYTLSGDEGSTILIDTGLEAKDITHALETYSITPSHVFITHAHRDHIGGTSTLIKRYPHLTVLASNTQKVEGSSSLPKTMQIEIGNYKMKFIPIPGHAEDAVAIVVHAPEWNAVAVGDAIYGRSAGKIPTGHRKGLKRLALLLEHLTDDTLILPGHGPVSTVAMEKRYNPFLAAMIAS